MTPVIEAEYVAVHNARPNGVRRWRFVCTDATQPALKIEADGEYVHILPHVQAMAQNQIGDCEISVMATSGPPRPTGQPLERDPGGTPPDWAFGTVRPWWIGE